MTKKNLPTNTVLDDLEGSPFFKRRPTSETENRPVLTDEASPLPVHADELVTSSPRRIAASPDRRATSKRIIVRRGFDYYEDQLTDLKKISLQEQLEGGGDGSMSRMLRDALDEYLKKRLNGSSK